MLRRLNRWLSRFAASDAERDASELRDASREAGCVQLSRCAVGAAVTVNGRLTQVAATPQGEAPRLSALLYDGSGSVWLVWLGRRHIPGIEAGRGATVEGRLARGDDGYVIYNPSYTLEASHA